MDGTLAIRETAAKIAETAVGRFGSIDALVNNAGIFFTKRFTDYTAEDFRSLVSTNLEGFLYITQLAIKQMLSQNTGGSIVTITASLVDNPIAGVTAAVPMITKGGPERRHLPPGDGVRAGRHSRERGRPRGRGHPAARDHSGGRPENAVADGPRFDREEIADAVIVFDGSRDGDRRGAPRRRRGTRPWQVVSIPIPSSGEEHMSVKAWVATAAKQKLVLQDIDLGPLGAEDVEIAVEHCGLCHSDVSVLNNDWGISQYPAVLGHEVVGRVTAVGPATKGVKVGQRGRESAGPPRAACTAGNACPATNTCAPRRSRRSSAIAAGSPATCGATGRGPSRCRRD